VGPRCAGGKEASLAFSAVTFVIKRNDFSMRCELNAWREVKDGWRPLYGDVDQFGVAVEWHDFRTAGLFDWGKSFHRAVSSFV